MKVILKLILLFVVLFTFLPSAGLAGQDNDKTLSPYFVVKGGDTSVDRFPLKETKADVHISGIIADVMVTQRYVNEGSRPINARYVFPASTRAAVYGMKMKIGDHIVTARIQERKAAQRTFEKAKEEGKSASLLDQERPNVFTMNVANIMPGDKVEIELRYTELLIPTTGVYEFVYPTVVGPRYSDTPESGAPESDKWVKSPYLREGNKPTSTFNIAVDITGGVPVEDIACSTHKIKTVWPDRSTATVILDESEADGGNRDFILKYRLTGKKIHSGLMLYRGNDENFFLLTVQPPRDVKTSDIPAREYIFVVDVSGSMYGFPLDISKNLLSNLISGLRPTDRFNIVLFSGRSVTMSPESVSANQENIDQAIRLIDGQHGSGGTELCAALQTALSIPRRDNVSRSVILVTDGYISAEKEALQLIRENLNSTNFFSFGIGSSVNRYLIEGVAHAGQGEPFVVTKQEEAAATAEKFRNYIASPLLTGIAVSVEGFKVYDVEPEKIPDMFAQRPIAVIGKWSGSPEGKMTITGQNGKNKFSQTFNVADSAPSDKNSALRQLWARKKLTNLSDFNTQHGGTENKEEIVNLGIKYNLLTAHTSFIAVYEVVRNPETKSQNVTQPLPLPSGVSNFAVGGGMQNAPEPEFYLLLIMATLIIMVAALRKIGWLVKNSRI
ncbi:MAG: motif-containing protein, putative exosortase substrate [Deltaproteobacteria bacterium]|nr:motif-containing protein, putative exosortase substrate [Deltaproteobacteria bacterium]